MIILAYAGAIIFIAISLLHIYWLFGTRGLSKAVPPDKAGNNIVPHKLIILVSALIFLCAGLLPLAALGIIPLPISHQVYMVLLIIGLVAIVVRGLLGLVLSLRSSKPRGEFNSYNIRFYTPIIAVLALSYLATLLLL